MLNIEGLSASPPVARETPPAGKHRIECWDYSAMRLPYKGRIIASAGLLQQASVELGEPISWHPALRADHVTVGKAVPLAGLVRSGLPGVIGVEATSCRRSSAVGLLPRSERHVDEVTAAVEIRFPTAPVSIPYRL